ncbi:MAG TPA: PhzF family phenazine biosynthesis protein [Thermoanaerobaculia bacterium]|nr:PhzF family phenazine biosynthesis protein [Thermoanaerobaculia bacterium]
MRRLPLYQVDAFADEVFSGNPAAVCVLTERLADDVLQAIAAENNLSETAFIEAERDPMPLRWFTPREEVPLCGHATLAAAFVVMRYLAPERRRVEFLTVAGRLTVSREGASFTLDFPALELRPVSTPSPQLRSGLGVEAKEIWICDEDPNYFVFLDSESALVSLEPRFDQLERLHPYGVAVSARSESSDFVSRYFAPGYGIPEDPVTGSIHCALAPWWAKRLGRSSLSARQLSLRGGRLDLEVGETRVRITGRAVGYLEGQILLP